jgi:thiol-disulfide isomerase/thioredoxin
MNPTGTACELISSSGDLERALKSKERLFVLFYASWCPFSQMFLPHFLDHADSHEHCYLRVPVDDKDDLVHKYSIGVYPTVLYFEKGKIVRRLDGVYHVGLNRGQLEAFVRQCGVP